MISVIRTCGLMAGFLAASAVGGPVAARDVEVVPALQKRDIQLGSFSLATSYENDVLFKIGAGVSGTSSDGTVAEAFSLEVECVDCQTWGTAVVSTAGVTKDESIIGDIISFFEHPLDVIADAFDLDVRIDFENVGGHFEFDIFAADTVSYSFPIFESESPVGIACSEDVSLGLVLYIDLVFSLTAEIDLEAGFDFSFPDGAYITVNPINGDIVDQGFSGGQLNQLPVTVTSGEAIFKAALRIRVQAGTTVEVFGTGFDFELGVYADLIEYVATIGTSPECELLITESVDCNVGAFAHAVAEIDYKTCGASPAVVTTLIDIPLPSLCLTRPIDTSLPALPTSTSSGSVITSGAAATTSGSAAISTAAASSAAASSAPVSSAASSIATSTGGISAQGSTTLTFPSASASTYASSSASASGSAASSYSLNGTITSAASLTTSTVISTTLITITSCSSTVLHCPASLTSEIVITSTTILYTTVCPVGQVQPTFTLATSVATSAVVTYPASIATATVTASPISLTPCATPVVSTVYTPTLTTPTYAVPTQTTTFTVLNPGYSASSAAGVASTITIAPVYSATGAPYPPVSTVKPAGSASNSTVSGSTSLPSSTTLPFTAGASRSSGSVMGGLVVALVGAFALL